MWKYKMWWHFLSWSILNVQRLKGTLTSVSRDRKTFRGQGKQDNDHYSICRCWYWRDSCKEPAGSWFTASHKPLLSQGTMTELCVKIQRASYPDVEPFNCTRVIQMCSASNSMMLLFLYHVLPMKHVTIKKKYSNRPISLYHFLLMIWTELASFLRTELV